MKRKFYFFRKTTILLCLILGFSQCTKKEEIKPKPKYNDEYDFVFIDIQRYFGEPIKAEYANKVGNEFSKEKVVLGEKLYNEKRLSKDNTVSCASCHDLKKGGTDNLPNSKGIIGADGKPLRGDRNAPSVINAALTILGWKSQRCGRTSRRSYPKPYRNGNERQFGSRTKNS